VLWSNQSIIFEVRFDPSETQKAYSKDLIARIFHVPCCITKTQISNDLLMNVIPEIITIRLIGIQWHISIKILYRFCINLLKIIGHTYDNNTYNWIPYYQIPKKITMPACVPNLAVYTTFIIKNFGPSLMFCFIPPTISNYRVKPMAGLMNQ
jgi:hypothetical protein